jgi:hypothetical protein
MSDKYLRAINSSTKVNLLASAVAPAGGRYAPRGERNAIGGYEVEGENQTIETNESIVPRCHRQ